MQVEVLNCVENASSSAYQKQCIIELTENSVRKNNIKNLHRNWKNCIYVNSGILIPRTKVILTKTLNSYGKEFYGLKKMVAYTFQTNVGVAIVYLHEESVIEYDISPPRPSLPTHPLKGIPMYWHTTHHSVDKFAEIMERYSIYEMIEINEF